MLDLDVQTVKGAVVAGILVVVVGGVLLAATTALAKAWKRRYWQGTAKRAVSMGRLFNDGRKMLVARKRTRLIAWREMLSGWRKAPLWLLRATLFRWFEESPTTDWPYMKRVFEDHADDEAKAQAETLLWEVRAVLDLRARERIMEHQHVALVHPCSRGVFVLTNADSSGNREKRFNADQQVKVKRGWCSNVREPGDSCRFCDLSDQELQQTIDSLMAEHECPPPHSPA